MSRAEKNIIGRLAVEVFPDTKKFRKLLKAQMEAIEHRQDPIRVEAEVDASHLVSSLNRSIRIADDQARDIHVGVDLDDKRKEWDKIVREMRRDAAASVQELIPGRT